MEGGRLIQTAASRALTKHVILSNILHWISLDDDKRWRADTPLDQCLQAKVNGAESFEEASDALGMAISGYWYGWGGVLLRCMLVSRPWYVEGVKALWRDPVGVLGYCAWSNSLVALFGKLEPARRNFHANLVEGGFFEIGAWDCGAVIHFTLSSPRN